MLLGLGILITDERIKKYGYKKIFLKNIRLKQLPGNNRKLNLMFLVWFQFQFLEILIQLWNLPFLNTSVNTSC